MLRISNLQIGKTSFSGQAGKTKKDTVAVAAGGGGPNEKRDNDNTQFDQANGNQTKRPAAYNVLVARNW